MNERRTRPMRLLVGIAAAVVSSGCGVSTAAVSMRDGMFAAPAFTRAVHEMETRPTAPHQLVSVAITPTTADFGGYDARHHATFVQIVLPGRKPIVPHAISVFGSIDQGFPLADLHPWVPAQLLARIRARQPRFVVRQMNLVGDYVSGDHTSRSASWNVEGVVGKRLVFYTADADGTHLLGHRVH